MGSDREMRARVLGLQHEGKNVRVELATLGGEAASLFLEPTSDGRGVERLQLGDGASRRRVLSRVSAPDREGRAGDHLDDSAVSSSPPMSSRLPRRKTARRSAG